MNEENIEENKMIVKNNKIIKPNKISLIDKWKMSRKVSVPSVKQYLVDEFNLVKELEKQNDELHKQIKGYEHMQEQYELSLITLNEYKERIKNKNHTIEELKKEIKENEKVSKSIEKDLKERIVDQIKNTKGILSKDKIIDIIKNE